MKKRGLGLLFLLLSAIGVPSCARAEVPELLQAALDSLVAEDKHWAFTETTRDLTKKHGDTIARFDPSRPPGKQWELVQWQGKPPSERFSRRWQKRKMQEEEEEEVGESIGELMLAENASVKSSGGGLTVFEIPLRKANSSRLPGDKCSLLFTVDEARRAVTQVDLITLAPFRMAAVAHLKDFRLRILFAQVDAAHPPAVKHVTIGIQGRAFGILKIDERQEITLSEHRRVKPYKDRFTVEIGKVKALGF